MSQEKNTLKINADAEVGISVTIEAIDDPMIMTMVFHPSDGERVCTFVELVQKVAPALELTYYVGGYKVDESLWKKYIGAE